MEFSRKSAAGLVLVISLIAGAFVWGNDRPTSGTWAIKIDCTGSCRGIADILWHYLRPDREPDYLHRIQGAISIAWAGLRSGNRSSEPDLRDPTVCTKST